jgi:outer membrane biosynthesis protein TonB
MKDRLGYLTKLLFLFFPLLLHSTLSLAVEGGSLFVQTNTPGATVYLDDNQIGKTDVNGGFLIDNIPPGTYKISIEMEGYKRTEKSFKIKGEGLTEQANIKLQPLTPPIKEPKAPEKKIEPAPKLREPVAVPKVTVPPPPEIPKEVEKVEKVELPEKPKVEEKPSIPAKEEASRREPLFGMFELWMVILIIVLIAGVLFLIFGKKILLKKERPRLTIKTPVKPLRVTTPIKGVSLEEAPGVGDYRILEKVASGGMANVYKAVHMKKGWMVALKVPHEQFQSDRTFVERFRREGELGKKLHNENIIHIYESATAKDGFTYIAMEYLEGIDLRQYMDKHGKLPIEEALNIIVHVCRALDYAHVKGVVHRDIKPENIMLPLQKGKGKVVLMDFGIAHTAYLGTLGTGSTYLGTPYYMSPDQISSKEVDGRSDIYSLGVVLFEMLTGQHLFDETDPLKVLFHHKETPPPRPSTINSKIPPTLEQIVLKMLTKKPENRYQTVEDLLVELQEFMLKEGIENE